MIHKHYLIHKPFGMLSQLVSKDNRQIRSKRFLGELYPFVEGTMPIGRLDEKSEGLLLLTTNGKLANTVNRGGIEKEYYAQVDGIANQNMIDKICKGVEISINGKKYITKPCKASLISDPKFEERSRRIRGDHHGPTSWVSIILREGKFRQVRKMTAEVGFPTLRLVRIRIGNIVMDQLKCGETIELKNVEAKLGL